MNEEIQRINLDDYIQTGEGGTALTYTHKDGLSLAKLYNPGFEADRAKAEFLTARAVFELGIPSPEPFRLITDGQRSGAEYELIKNKRSYTRIISQEPERLEEISYYPRHDTMQAHWDIFFPAYLGTNDPQAINEATQLITLQRCPTSSTWYSIVPCPMLPCRTSGSIYEK